VGGGSQHGKACSSASDCVDGDQQGDCFGIKPAGTRPHGIMSTASFLEIFAKTIVSYSWGGSSYQKDTTPDSDYRKIFGSSDLPVVKAAIGGGQSGWQESDQVGTLAVNGFEPELDDDGLPLPDVYEGGEAYVRLTFFAYNESGDHMPLRRIIVDWDDKLTDDPTDLRTATVAFPQGMGSPLDTAYPNFKPECQGDNFGDDAAACRESFFSVQRLYSCSPDEATDSCTNIERLDGTLYSGPCCKYKPKVVVVDNWGLCAAHSACVNGICMVPNLADDLHNNECYYDDGGMIQLRPGRYSAVYQGEIVVIPEGL